MAAAAAAARLLTAPLRPSSYLGGAAAAALITTADLAALLSVALRNEIAQKGRERERETADFRFHHSSHQEQGGEMLRQERPEEELYTLNSKLGSRLWALLLAPSRRPAG